MPTSPKLRRIALRTAGSVETMKHWAKCSTGQFGAQLSWAVGLGGSRHSWRSKGCLRAAASAERRCGARRTADAAGAKRPFRAGSL